MEHFWFHRRVDPQHMSIGFQPGEHGIAAVGAYRGFQLGDLMRDYVFEEIRPRLGIAPVDQPAVTRTDPGDRIGQNSGAQQPHGGVHRRLAAAQNEIAFRQVSRVHPQIGQGTGNDHADAVCDLKLAGVGSGHTGLISGGINRLAPHRDLRFFA